MPKHDISNQKDDKATFIVEVRFRRNATWQGTVRWIEGMQSRNFRSALELIRLIDSARGECEENPDLIQLKAL